MLWFLGGLLIVVIACFLIEPISNIWNMGLAMLSIFCLSMLFGLGIVLMCMPLFLAEQETEYNAIEACERFGGHYTVIGEEWDVSTNTYFDIYGCVKGD